ncbi:hypothetical protein [Rhodoligotrophos defluvii]|uniref:hypothetical protein n=1 Tax=Rhodoligotrophos defluvii TaxID=2561934 RepID=UPI0010CA00CC|nr:hypothetical protein [Rhodoligotrophos defluvii]
MSEMMVDPSDKAAQSSVITLSFNLPGWMVSAYNATTDFGKTVVDRIVDTAGATKDFIVNSVHNVVCFTSSTVDHMKNYEYHEHDNAQHHHNDITTMH